MFIRFNHAVVGTNLSYLGYIGHEGSRSGCRNLTPNWVQM